MKAVTSGMHRDMTAAKIACNNARLVLSAFGNPIIEVIHDETGSRTEYAVHLTIARPRT